MKKESFKFRECKEYEITLAQTLSFVHHYTEILDIKIVNDCYSLSRNMPAGCKRIPEFLSENVFGICEHNGVMICNSKNSEVGRILKYYGDCPCYNLVTHNKIIGKLAMPVIIVHVHFSDIIESFIQEKKDNRRRIRNGKSI